MLILCKIFRLILSVKSAQVCVEISSSGLLKEMATIQVEYSEIQAKAGPSKKIAP
jgi:hypothetical protein